MHKTLQRYFASFQTQKEQVVQKKCTAPTSSLSAASSAAAAAAAFRRFAGLVFVCIYIERLVLFDFDTTCIGGAKAVRTCFAYPHSISFWRLKRFLQRTFVVLDATFDLLFLDATHYTKQPSRGIRKSRKIVVNVRRSAFP